MPLLHSVRAPRAGQVLRCCPPDAPAGDRRTSDETPNGASPTSVHSPRATPHQHLCNDSEHGDSLDRGDMGHPAGDAARSVWCVAQHSQDRSLTPLQSNRTNASTQATRLWRPTDSESDYHVKARSRQPISAGQSGQAPVPTVRESYRARVTRGPHTGPDRLGAGAGRYRSAIEVEASIRTRNHRRATAI